MSYAGDNDVPMPRTTKSAIPHIPHIRSLQKACNLHARILMGVLSQKPVPTGLPAEPMASFETRFSASDGGGAHMPAAAIPSSDAVYGQVTALLTSAKAKDSQTARDVARIAQHHLYLMFTTVANAGLHSFAPDVSGNPEST
ncbi:hypothetical protein C8F04DRAFT_1276078 [Mycena alexandri]|uniref:Uncharacterized protein n=1 Tax=Mycena alexandri TaxID=1745969 RepID=A0AAD6S2C1_9AGAR|nr:hypothetical protein C8F04DRAFT_1276078 [Mycena alexandri]